MPYLLFNITSSGKGYQLVGTFRSRERAQRLADHLQAESASRFSEEEQGMNGSSWRVEEISAMDKYTDESILDYAKDC